MAGYVEVNTDGMTRSLGEMSQAGDHITNALRDLQAKLAGYGACWGDDAAGQQFLDQYAPPRNQLIAGVDALGGVVHSVADGIQAMSKGYAEIDQNAKQMSTQIAGNTDAQITAVPATNSGGGDQAALSAPLATPTRPGTPMRPSGSGGAQPALSAPLATPTRPGTPMRPASPAVPAKVAAGGGGGDQAALSAPLATPTQPGTPLRPSASVVPAAGSADGVVGSASAPAMRPVDSGVVPLSHTVMSTPTHSVDAKPMVDAAGVAAAPPGDGAGGAVLQPPHRSGVVPGVPAVPAAGSADGVVGSASAPAMRPVDSGVVPLSHTVTSKPTHSVDAKPMADHSRE
jgi:uncharacterized protein YukE